MKKTILFLLGFLSVHTISAEKTEGSISGLPAISAASETGLQLGALLMYFLPKEESASKTSTVGFAVLGSFKNQWRFVLFPDLYLDESTHLKVSAEYQYWPTDFYGIGNNTLEEDQEIYLSKNMSLSGYFEKMVVSGLWLGLNFRFYGESLEWDHEKVPYEHQLVQGHGATENGLGILLNWDQRDHHNFPRKGYQLVVSTLSYLKWLGSDENFHTIDYNAKGFLPFLSAGALGLNLSATSTHGTVPFRRLSSPDGSSELRGISAGRYRDNNKLSSTFEIRHPVWWRFGLVGFYDLSQVAPQFSDMSLSDFHQSPGIGIRFAFNPEDKYNVRADFSYVDLEGVGITINVRESF